MSSKADFESNFKHDLINFKSKLHRIDSKIKELQVERNLLVEKIKTLEEDYKKEKLKNQRASNTFDATISDVIASIMNDKPAEGESRNSNSSSSTSKSKSSSTNAASSSNRNANSSSTSTSSSSRSSNSKSSSVSTETLRQSNQSNVPKVTNPVSSSSNALNATNSTSTSLHTSNQPGPPTRSMVSGSQTTQSSSTFTSIAPPAVASIALAEPLSNRNGSPSNESLVAENNPNRNPFISSVQNTHSQYSMANTRINNSCLSFNHPCSIPENHVYGYSNNLPFYSAPISNSTFMDNSPNYFSNAPRNSNNNNLITITPLAQLKTTPSSLNNTSSQHQQQPHPSSSSFSPSSSLNSSSTNKTKLRTDRCRSSSSSNNETNEGNETDKITFQKLPLAVEDCIPLIEPKVIGNSHVLHLPLNIIRNYLQKKYVIALRFCIYKPRKTYQSDRVARAVSITINDNALTMVNFCCCF